MNNIFQVPRDSYEESRLTNLSVGWILLTMGVVALIIGLCALGIVSWLLLPGLSLAAVGLLTLLGNLVTLRRI